MAESLTIEQQTAAYLHKGGVIQCIQQGVTANPDMTVRQVSDRAYQQAQINRKISKIP